MKLTTGNVKAEGQIHITELQRKPVRDTGLILLQWRALAVALDVKDALVRAILVQPTAWYTKELAARGK